MRDEKLYALADIIYEQLLQIPSRLLKHKCGQPISKETAVAKIYWVLEEDKHQSIAKENEDIFKQVCTRSSGHDAPCNGLPREDCPQLGK